MKSSEGLEYFGAQIDVLKVTKPRLYNKVKKLIKYIRLFYKIRVKFDLIIFYKDRIEIKQEYQRRIVGQFIIEDPEITFIIRKDDPDPILQKYYHSLKRLLYFYMTQRI